MRRKHGVWKRLLSRSTLSWLEDWAAQEDSDAFLVHKAERWWGWSGTLDLELIRLFFFCKMLESSVIISWEIRRSVYVQRKEKTKWTWSQLFWLFVVKRSLSEHLLWLSSVFAISHLILGRGHAPGHPQRRDKIQPCVSSLCDLGIGSWALLWPQ